MEKKLTGSNRKDKLHTRLNVAYLDRRSSGEVLSIEYEMYFADWVRNSSSERLQK